MYLLKFEHFNITDSEIISVDGNLSMSPVMDDLKFDELRFEFAFDMNKQVYKDDCKKGKSILFYVNDRLIQKMFVSDFKRKSETIYNITITSIVGVWDKKNYRGNFFSGTTLANVVNEIVGTEASVSDAVSDIPVYGFIKYSTKREAMHMVLFATGCIIVRDYNGNPFITSWSQADLPVTISDDDIDKDDITYTETEKASEIIVTEHSYTVDKDAEYSIAFDNTDRHEQVYNSVVKFSVPIQTDDYKTKDAEGHEGAGLIVTHLTPASCEVTGIGQLLVKQYIHSESEQRRKNEDVYETQEMSSNDCTLVCAANSGNVMDRLFGYYTNIKEATFGIKAGDIYKCGDYLSVPFWNDFHDGFVTNMDLVYSKMRKAVCTIAIGFKIVPAGNNYKYFKVIRNATSFTVPQGVTKIRVYLIGGGNAGQSGCRSKAAETGKVAGNFSDPDRLYMELDYPTETSNYDNVRIVWNTNPQGAAKGGIGGKKGSHGRGARSIGVELDVTPGQVFQIECGHGGIGANGTYESDDPVDPTVLPTPSRIWTDDGILSSDSGSYGPLINIFNGEAYCLDGDDGLNGADGGDGGYSTDYEDTSWLSPKPYGSPGKFDSEYLQEHPEIKARFPNGIYGSEGGKEPIKSEFVYGVGRDGYSYFCGTGAGAGTDLSKDEYGLDNKPENGKNPSVSSVYDDIALSIIGGRGADAIVPNRPETSNKLGNGGNGGFGAGGPGGGGNVAATIPVDVGLGFIKEVMQYIYDGEFGENPTRFDRLEESFPGMYPIFQGLVNWCHKDYNDKIELMEDACFFEVIGLARAGVLSCPDKYGTSKLWRYDWPFKFFYEYGGDPGTIAAGGPGGNGADGGFLIYY